MKAWRLDAPNVNLRREMGSKEPTARVQMRAKQVVKTAPNASNWLLAGLLGHGGYNAVSYVPDYDTEVIPPTEGMARKASRYIRNLRKPFGV